MTTGLFNASQYLLDRRLDAGDGDRPRRIVFVDAYPTTATGKIRRVELRAMASTVLATPAR